ncbi:MAG: hypothetical protein I4N51_04210, partial [Acinetobacter sp.]|nr:hypothetical protein [Acinetobacter sp.]
KIMGYKDDAYLTIRSVGAENNVYTGYINNGNYLKLKEGNYEITISSNGEYRTNYIFSLVDLLSESVDEIQFNQIQTLSIDSNKKTNIKTLNGETGDSWLIDLRNLTTNNQYSYWELYDPSGNRAITSSQYANEDNAIKYTLKQSGQYVLLIWANPSTTSITTSIIVTKPLEHVQNINIGDQVSGQITQGGDVHTYKLILDKPTAFIVDAVIDSTNFSILREDGSLITSSAYSVQYLPAGNYRFIFSGNNSATPRYSFGLIDYVEKSLIVNSLDNISFELNTGEKFVSLALKTQNGQKYAVDFSTSTGLAYQLIDANGQILLNSYDSESSSEFVAATDLIYLVATRTRAVNTKQFKAQVLPVLNSITPLKFDQIINVSMSKRNDQASYTFSIVEEGWFNLDNIVASDPNITLSLLGQNNTEIFSYNNLSQANGEGRIYLTAGHYSLKIKANTDYLSSMQFNVYLSSPEQKNKRGLTLNTAQELYLDDLLQVTLNQPVIEQPYLYRFSLKQGDLLNVEISDMQIGRVRLLDALGNELILGTAGSLQYHATKTDIYYLELKSNSVAVKNITLKRTKANQILSNDVGDTLATAKELNFKTDTKFKITTQIGDGNNTSKDVDLYQIMLVEGERLNITSYTNSSFSTRIFDQTGKEVYRTNYGGETGNYFYTATKTSIYYIGLSGYNNYNYNPLTGSNTQEGYYTGLNSVVFSRQSGFIRPVTQFAEQISIHENIISTENWSGSVAANSSQEFYFEVNSDGLYYLDRSQSNYNSSDYYHVSVLDSQSRIIGGSFNSAYYLKAGVYKYIISNSSNAENIQFKWINLYAQAMEIQYGQSITLDYSKNATANRVFKLYADAGQTIQFNSLGQLSGNTPLYRVVNEFGQAITGNNLSSLQDGQLISLKHSGYYYIIFDDISSGYNSEYYQHSGSVSFQFDRINLLNIPQLSLNEKISGLLNAANQEVAYSLQINKKSTILFDLLTVTDSDVLFTIVDHNGVTVFSDYSTNLTNSRILQLNSGNYIVKVKAASFNQQAYAFKLLDLTQIQQLNSGQIVEDRLKSEGELFAYQIEANAGDRIFIDFDDLIIQSYGYFNGQWKQNYTTNLIVIDPYGRQQVISRNNINNLGSEFVATVSGQYRILFDELNRNDIDLPFRMAVYVHGPSNPIV